MPEQPKSAPDTLSFDEAWTPMSQPHAQGTPKQPGFVENVQRGFDEATTPEAYSGDVPMSENVGRGLRNLGGGALSLLTPLIHPVGTAKGMIDLMANGPYSATAQHMVEPFVKKPDETGGQYAGRLGGELTSLGGQAATAELGGLATRGVSRLMDPLREYRSPLIPPEEASARAMTDVIRPNPLDYKQTVRNLQDVGPYIRQAASKYQSPLEFGKAADLAGKEQTNFFKGQFIEPDEMRLGDAYGEVGNINAKLRPIYRSRSMGEMMTKEAQDNMQALEQRRDELSNFIYDEASARTGVPREQIQAINQRGAQLQQIGDVTDSAQSMRRAGFSGYTPTGLPIPQGGIDRAVRLMQYLRGGPEAVAGRKLTSIMKRVPGEVEPLPNPESLSGYRQMSNTEELGHLKDLMEQSRQNKSKRAIGKANTNIGTLMTIAKEQ